MPVLWESSEPYGFGAQWSGLTGNYLRVVAQTNTEADLQNRVIETDLVDTAPAALMGQLPPSMAAQLQYVDMPELRIIA